MKLANFKIGTRLGVAFTLTAVLMVIVAAIGFVSVSAISSYTHRIVHRNMVEIDLSRDMKEQVHVMRRVVRSLALVEGEKPKEQRVKEIQATRDGYDKAWQALQQLPVGAQGRDIRDRIGAARAAVVPAMDKVIELARSGYGNYGNAAINMLTDVVAPKVDAWEQALADNVAYLTRAAKAEGVSARRAETRAQILLAAITGLALLLGQLAAWLITRSVTRPLAEAVAAADRVAAGDLTLELHARGRDEVASLTRSMSQMVARLRDTVATVRRNAENVSAASAQIAHRNNDLSSRTAEQAAALEETSASMEELDSTVKQNADNASQANQLAQGASAVADQGGEVVGQVVETMQGISDSGKRIAEIIGMIDDIAFQTNLLALNAAVEAARAGEHGRGFAVVAGEVRKLAQRSSDAAKEINALITANAEHVEQGSTLVGQAGDTMSEIVKSIKRVTELMNEISAASTEQSAGVMQVGEAVTQMDQATQQNAALVEQSAAAAESLKNQAQQLVQVVATFELVHGDERAQAAAAMPAAAAAAGTVDWDGAERRGPDRSQNVIRPEFDGIVATNVQADERDTAPSTEAFVRRAGTDDEWTSF